MNNRGWGLQAMMSMVFVLMFALVVIAIVVNTKFQHILDVAKTNNSYVELEEKVSNALKEYKQEVKLESDELKVNISTLKSNGLLNDLIDKDNNKCSGYGKIRKINDNYVYSSYIKCGDYKTSGFDD